MTSSDLILQPSHRRADLNQLDSPSIGPFRCRETPCCLARSWIHHNRFALLSIVEISLRINQQLSQVADMSDDSMRCAIPKPGYDPKKTFASIFTSL